MGVFGRLAEALHDMRHIAADSPDSAHRVRERVGAAVALLCQSPVGRPGRVMGTYEKSVRGTSLIIAYELPGDDRVGILRIIHTRRDWPGGRWPIEEP